VTLLTLLRSQVPASATICSGRDYTVAVDYDQTSGAVSGLSWTTASGPLTVGIKSAGAGMWQLSGIPPGSSSAPAPAGQYLDDTFEAYTSWSAS
jgi:hypothetical protein